MGSLYTTQYVDFKIDEWKKNPGLLVNFECLKDNSTIELVDFENKIHKMTFRKGGKFVFEKIEGKYKFFWNDKDLV